MLKIEEMKITVSEITKGYINNDEQGVRGYNVSWIFVHLISVNSFIMSKSNVRLLIPSCIIIPSISCIG